MKNSIIDWAALTVDGIQNAFSRLGTTMDKNTQTVPGGMGQLFDELQINHLYYDSSLMRRIIDRPARDALKRGFEVRFEDKELEEWVAAELKRLKAVKTLRTALRLSRKNGGAGIVMLDSGSSDLLKAAPENSKIVRIRAHSRWTLNAFDRDRSYNSEHWNQPSQYALPGGKRVHHSRVIRLIGLEVDDSKTDDYSGWGQSWVEAVWPSYRDLQTCSQSLATQMHDAIFNVLRLKNLPSLLSRGKEGSALLDSRIETINLGKSLLRTLVLDTEEQYDTVATDLSKLVAPYDIFAQQLSADSNIPLTILFGQAPKGWSSTDLNAIESYYEFLEGIQEEDITPAISELVDAILRQRGIKADYDVWWAPIEKPDEKTAAEVRSATVTTDLALFSIGAMDAEEIRSRHYGEGFKSDLALAEPPASLLPASAVPEMISDAISKQLGTQKAMICAYPSNEWLTRFRSCFPYADEGTHLTLEFMGSLSEADLLNTMAAMDFFGQNPNSPLGPVLDARVIIKGIGSFFNRGDFCEVLLVEPTEQLRRLQAGIADVVSGTKMLSEHSWLPHVTVAYHEAAFQTAPVEMSDFPEWRIDRICLVVNDEALHTVMIPST